MTLLELLVALAIFAIVGAALFPVVNGAMDSRNRATARTSTDAGARLVLDRLEQDIAANCDPGFPGALPVRFVAAATPERGGATERTILETTTLVARGVTAADGFVGGEDVAALSTDRGDLAQVLWRIDADGRLLRHELRPPTTEPIDWTKVPFEVLADHADVAMEFYEPTMWQGSWDSGESGPHHGKAPAAVRTTLRLAGDDETTVELVSTVVLPAVQTYIDLRRPGGTP